MRGSVGVLRRRGRLKGYRSPQSNPNSNRAWWFYRKEDVYALRDDPGFRRVFFSSRRRHTRFDCDWSSDVCSSDLFMAAITRGLQGSELTEMAELRQEGALGFTDDGRPVVSAGMLRLALQYQRLCGGEIGRASGRERGEISGVAGDLKKKKGRVDRN